MLGSVGLPSHNQQHSGDGVHDENSIGDVEENTDIVKGKVDSVRVEEISQLQDTLPVQQKDDDGKIVEKISHQTNFIEHDGFGDQKALESDEKDLVKSDERGIKAANGEETEKRIVESFSEEMRHGKEEINIEVSDGSDVCRQRTDSNSSTQSQTTRSNALLHSLSTLKR